MNKDAQKEELFEQKTGIEETKDQPLDLHPHNSISKPKKRRPKRGGCGGLAGDTVTSLAGDGVAGVGGYSRRLTPLEREFVDAAIGGKASTFLAGNPSTSLVGESTVSLLPGTSGTSLLVLSKENIQKGAVIKKTDLEGYVLPKHVDIPDKVIRLEDLVGKEIQVDFPANGLLGLVVLTGDPSSIVDEIKLVTDRALVIRTKNAIQKGEVIKKEDLDVYLILKRLKNPNAITNSDNVVGKTATRKIKKNDILKNYMLK